MRFLWEQRIVASWLFLIIAPYKYFYLLTYLLTYSENLEEFENGSDALQGAGGDLMHFVF